MPPGAVRLGVCIPVTLAESEALHRRAADCTAASLAEACAEFGFVGAILFAFGRPALLCHALSNRLADTVRQSHEEAERSASGSVVWAAAAVSVQAAAGPGSGWLAWGCSGLSWVRPLPLLVLPYWFAFGLSFTGVAVKAEALMVGLIEESFRV